MSAISEDKMKYPLELISNLLTKLLDSKISRLETKSKDEMNNIKSISQNTEIIMNELKKINEKMKPKRRASQKVLNVYNYINTNKKNSIKTSPKLNTSFLVKKTEHTPDRKYFSKIKTTKNNNIKLKLNRSDIFSNNFLTNKSQNNSKILNCPKRGSRMAMAKKSRSKKKKRDLTPRPSTPNSMLRKVKEKEKLKYGRNNKRVLKHNHTCTDFYKQCRNKSCKILPSVKKDKLNVSKISKNDELDLLCATTDDDKRIYDLNPDKKINILNKDKNKNKKISSILFTRRENKDKKYENKDLLTLNDSMMNDINNDELLIFYHNKKTMRLIDDITLTKSFLGDEPDCDLDLDINIDNNNNLNNLPNIKNNNYTLAERLENLIEYLLQYLTKEELLKIGLINKECFKMIMHYLISKTEDSIDDAKEALSNLKNNNSKIIDQNDLNNDFTIKPFEFNFHSCRAITLLNSIPNENIFHIDKYKDFKNKKIILVFDLFFIALGYKNKIISFKDDIKSKWNFYKTFFEKNSNNFGNTIENKIKGKIFDNEIINSLYEYSKNNVNIITPSYFKKINNDIALFVFIVKNILEHVGITKDANNKINAIKLYLLYNARICMNSIILQKLNKINSIISDKK